MKKALKITGITLAILIGIVLIAAGIALAVLTSSGHLTKILKHYAPRIVNCETELGSANLTLFKTFPNVGIDIEHVALINPMEGSPSDTLANIDNVTLLFDIKKLLKEDRIEVGQCILEQAFVNIYTDSEGNCNLNVFNTKDKADSTVISFDYLVDLEEITLKNSTVFFTDERSQLTLQVKGLDMDLNGNFKENDIRTELSMKMDDFYLLNYATPFELKNVNLGFNGDIKQFDQISGVLTLDKPDVHLNVNEPSQNDTLSITLPVEFSLKNLSGRYDKGQACLKDYCLFLDGDVEIAENGELVFDFDVNSNTMPLEGILSYLPKDLQKTLNPHGTKDMMSLSVAKASVAINSNKLPQVIVKIQANDLAVNLSSLPHPFLELNGDVWIDTDLDKKTSDNIRVNDLMVKYTQSNLSANGLVELTKDVLLKLDIIGDVLLSDVKEILPKTMKLKGRVNFDLTTDFTVDELMKTLEDRKLSRIWAKADLKIKYLAFDMDNIHAATPQLNLCLALPASLKQKGKTGAYAAINSRALEAQIGEHLDANVEGAEIRLFADNFNGGIQDITLDATMSFGKLGMAYDTIVAVLNQSSLNLTTLPRKNAKGLNARLTIDSGDAEAQLGKNYALNTHSLGMNASVQQNKNMTGFFDQWNPEAELTLGNAMVKIDRLSEDIHISNIDFFFEPNLLDFKSCTFRLGQSDLSLQGDVTGIKDQAENHGSPVKGDFQLNTDLLDIKEIVGLINGLGLTKDTTENKESGPFIVPEGIDLTIGLNTKKTVYDNLDFNNLTGSVTMKDKALTLHDIRFTNKAAKMQLSALYQSLNRDSLFFAMDIHLLDIQISDLLHLIPYFDTLVPMLRTFDGRGEVNLDVETNLWPSYQPNISTLRAAADVKGKDWTVNDKFTFTRITDILHVSTNGEYRVDTLDVQLAFSDNKLDLLPSLVAIGAYKAIADGYLTTDKYTECHLSLTETPFPLRHGLKISGPFEKLKFELEESKYPNHYKPVRRSERNRQFCRSIKKKIEERKATSQ